ncbi:hypothetical protein BC834DRAFT_204192 [Gloeopeniophorella convolvens]|nr:hypothetical protein BC834DRAFT_204192 [Gloeopeniophorella convolvens]
MTVAQAKFVGPMPVNEFLDEFVPRVPDERPLICNPVNEENLIDTIRDAGICPNLVFVNAAEDPHERFEPEPDVAIFSRSRFCTEAHWSSAELWLQMRREDDDFFLPNEFVETHETILTSHIDLLERDYVECGELIDCMTVVHRVQFRAFSFAVALFGSKARLLRWDRSGIIYTDLFEWVDSDTLFEFFWRFDHLSDADRGYDTTVRSVTKDEAAVALPKLRQYPGFEDLTRDDLHKFLVRDDCLCNEDPRYYVAPEPSWATDKLIGRATFGFIAYDLANSNLVYLKDFWRRDLPGTPKEGDVYRELEAAKVSNIAKLGRAGDVPLTPECSTMSPCAIQRTRTQDFVKKDGRAQWCFGSPRVEPYVHYRLVLDTLGKPLDHFESTRQLCEVIRDAIVAHSEAYERTRILHRDVSAGNILITDDGRGILIDWELSTKVMTDAKGRPRRVSRRTGTWQFISTGLLIRPSSKFHELSDDLESFFWVLIYQLFRFRIPSEAMTAVYLPQVQFIFNQCCPSEKVATGGIGKRQFLAGTSGPYTLSLFVKTRCLDIVKEIHALFRSAYHLTTAVANKDVDHVIEDYRARDPTVQQALQKLRSSKALLDIINKHLASPWGVANDGSLALPSTDPTSPSAKQLKRKGAPDTSSGSDEHRSARKRRKGYLPPGSSPSGHFA